VLIQHRGGGAVVVRQMLVPAARSGRGGENLAMTSGDTERTRLANERTYLAWWRTGIAGVAAGFAVGRVVPEVVDGQSWPYVAVGSALTVAGLLAIVYGVTRYRELDAALREGREPARRDGALLVLAGIGVAVAVASIVLVLFAP
jgi:putative membrane protein